MKNVYTTPFKNIPNFQNLVGCTPVGFVSAVSGSDTTGFNRFNIKLFRLHQCQTSTSKDKRLLKSKLALYHSSNTTHPPPLHENICLACLANNYPFKLSVCDLLH